MWVGYEAKAVGKGGGGGGQEGKEIAPACIVETGQRKASSTHAYDGMTALEMPGLATMT